MYSKYFFPLVLALLFIGCKGKTDTVATDREENTEAKRMLQGIWIDREDESVSFMVKGDSIFYPDSVDIPVRFAIYGDTIVLSGSTEVGYAITKQAEHLFSFKNQNGDVVNLVKAENPDSYINAFEHRTVMALNQGIKIDRDSIIIGGDTRYHCYINVSPTTYKVFKHSYNDDGVEVENIYYDNIVHVSVFEGSNKIYSHDFRKADFAKYVPQGTIGQYILNDITLRSADANSVTMEAMVGIPDGVSNYAIKIVIGRNGKVTLGK